MCVGGGGGSGLGGGGGGGFVSLFVTAAHQLPLTRSPERGVQVEQRHAGSAWGFEPLHHPLCQASLLCVLTPTTHVTYLIIPATTTAHASQQRGGGGGGRRIKTKKKQHLSSDLPPTPHLPPNFYIYIFFFFNAYKLHSASYELQAGR